MLAKVNSSSCNYGTAPETGLTDFPYYDITDNNAALNRSYKRNIPGRCDLLLLITKAQTALYHQRWEYEVNNTKKKILYKQLIFKWHSLLTPSVAISIPLQPFKCFNLMLASVCTYFIFITWTLLFPVICPEFVFEFDYFLFLIHCCFSIW